MNKAPEEGQIWEWRAFGLVDEGLAAKVQAYPIRAGIIGLEGADIYFVSPKSDHNVKLRKGGDQWLLKLKLLLAKGSNSIELYSEGASMVFQFPIAAHTLSTAARLLGVRLPGEAYSVERLSLDEFVRWFGKSSPPLLNVEVSKTRSQFQCEGGWVELAEVTFPKGRVESLSIHSPDENIVKRILNRLQPGPELRAMNYLEACREWA